MSERSAEPFRNKVVWFSFVFSLLVIWIHSYNAELYLGKTAEMAWVYRMEHSIGDGIAQIAVPGFFMISGYLFYRDFSWDKLRGKWNRRIRSVLVPYMLWNFLYYLGYVVGSRLPWMRDVVGKGVIPFHLSAAVDAVINYTYNYVFWYLFQLILLILSAPVLYPVLKRVWSRGAFLAFVWLGIFLDARLPLLNLDALLYYAAAASAALSARGRRLAEQEPQMLSAGSGRNRVLGGLALLAVGAAAWRTGLAHAWTAGFVLCRLSVVAGLWLLVPARLLPEAAPFMKMNFFLYATHFALVRLINKTGARLLPGEPLIPLALFLAMPFLVLAVSACAGSILRKHLPKLWMLLNGGR